jgi:hypothetical protein
VRLLASQQMIAFGVSLPFSFVALQLLPRLGLKRLQIMSFTIMAAAFVVFGSFFNKLQSENDKFSLFILFCMSSIGIYSGCKMTTYSLPSALYKKEIRSSFNGFACGK